MKKQKILAVVLFCGFLAVMALGFFLLLIFCTFASAQVERMRFPQVTVGRAEAGILRQDGREEEYPYTVPLSALFTGEQGFQVFAVFQEHTRFGISYSVLALPAEILAMDEERAALGRAEGAGDKGIAVFCRLSVPSEYPLAAGFDLSQLVLVDTATGRGLCVSRPLQPLVSLKDKDPGA